MAVLAAVHVAVNWRYLGKLLTLRPRRATNTGIPGPSPSSTGSSRTTLVEGAAGQEVMAYRGDGDDVPSASASPASRPGLSRRAALTSTGAGAAGVIAGWFVRKELSPNPYQGGDVGEFYHRESSLDLRGLLSDLLEWGRAPGRYKSVAGGQPIPLPPVVAPPAMSVAQVLEQRRSLRSYAPRALTAVELGWLVRAATGITSAAEYRTAPSAGALYPIETYVAVSRVEGIDAGLYHVDVRSQALQQMRADSVAGDLMIAGLGQGFLRSAPVVLIFTGVFQRTRWKYHQRHYRYICWEGGHIAQNVYLAAEAAGLGACMVGAFLDRSINDLLQVDSRQEAALGLVAVGAR
jgi:SagB-type dehydrogenase family enzyme